jgi:hypothetical protein
MGSKSAELVDMDPGFIHAELPNGINDQLVILMSHFNAK